MSSRGTPRASAKARPARAAAGRQERRNRILLIGVALAVLALIGVAVALIVQEANRSAISELDRIPENSDLQGGFSVGADGAAGTENDGAPVLDVYLDFMCPHCVELEAVNGADLTALREAGDLTVVYHPVAVVDPGAAGASRRSAEAVAVVGHYSPEHFGAFVHALLDAQAQELVALGDADLERIALEVGVPRPTVDAFTDAMFGDWVAATTTQMQRHTGSSSVPQLRLDGSPLEVDWTEAGALRHAIETAT